MLAHEGEGYRSKARENSGPDEGVYLRAIDIVVLTVGVPMFTGGTADKVFSKSRRLKKTRTRQHHATFSTRSLQLCNDGAVYRRLSHFFTSGQVMLKGGIPRSVNQY